MVEIRATLRPIALSLGMLVGSFCLVYFMPGVWGVAVLLFLLLCASIVVE